MDKSVSRQNDPAKATKGRHMTPLAAGAGAAHNAIKAKDQLAIRPGVCGAKSMYGKTFMGIVRTTFRIGPNGGFARI